MQYQGAARRLRGALAGDHAGSRLVASVPAVEAQGVQVGDGVTLSFPRTALWPMEGA